jgi:nucleoside-diphosphate-sugar epimerase
VISLNILVTGGAGFIGRWVVKRLLDDRHRVWVIDDLSNGRKENIEEFLDKENFKEFIHGDIKNVNTLKKLFENKFDICYHLGASINVQDSIDTPRTTFDNDVLGTFNVLEECRKYNTKIIFMSTCMVYDRANDENGITERHPIKPASPYAGSKISGENMVLSYWYAYGMPAVVIRPFNTYGPFQRTGGEGGVVAIFIKRNLEGKTLNIYGEGTQTRDLLYVEDCARFVVQAGYSDKVNGEIINAGLGRDITINELAALIASSKDKIKYVKHIHPQSEIQKLLCDYSKAKELLDWKPEISLEEGIKRTREWIKENWGLV